MKLNGPPGADVWSPARFEHNSRILERCQIGAAVVFGCVTGIIGATGLAGFGVYIVSVVLMAISLGLSAQGKVSSFYGSWRRLLLSGLTSGFGSFVLFWTLSYDIVHVYGVGQ